MGQRKTLLKSHTHPCQVKIVTMCLFPWLLFRFLRHIIILFFLVFLKGPCCLLKKVPVYRGKVTLTLTVLNQQLSTVFSSPEHKDPLQRQASLLLSKLCLFICFCFLLGFFVFSSFKILLTWLTLFGNCKSLQEGLRILSSILFHITVYSMKQFFLCLSFWSDISFV